jgi:predicted DNA-binding antitoxin AbrB/MazE fold protein
MRRFPRLTAGKVAPVLTLGIVGVLLWRGGGRVFSPGELNAERRGGELGGVTSHAGLGGNCAACHAPPWAGVTMADRCLDCHADVRRQLDKGGPLHGRLPAGKQCRDCHTEHQGPHGELTRLDRFDHAFAAFPLAGKHRGLDCEICHRGRPFKGVAQDCAGCHVEPAVHKGRFGTDCAACHATASWAERGSLGSFNHDLAAFKLTGKHKSVSCQSCHAGNVYKGTPQACVSCHAEPAVHKGRFGTGCVQCHSTASWKGATFKHTFPLTHGSRRPVACATCHKDPGQYKTYTCYGCHEHQEDRMVRRHPRIRNLGELAKCARCHPNGRELGERRRGEAVPGFGRPELVAVCAGAWESEVCPFELAVVGGIGTGHRPHFLPAVRPGSAYTMDGVRSSCPGGQAMPLTVEAVYENGVLKPTQPLPLEEHARVRVTIQTERTWAERTAGMLQWAGDPDVLRRVVKDPELGIMESP